MEFDLIVVGAGLTGASLVAALRNTPYRVALVESRIPGRVEGWDARIYAYSPENVRFLQDIGVWDRLDDSRHQAVNKMQIFGDAGGTLHFSAYESGVPALAWIGESAPLQLELWETIRRQGNVTLFCPAALERLDQADEHVSVTLSDGRQLKARLVVGADGGQSAVRRFSGIQEQVTPYQHHGVIANFEIEKPHHSTAWQWFDQGTILAYLPLPGKLMSMVWSVPPEKAADLTTISAKALSEAVSQAGHHVLGALKCMTPAQSFPLRLMTLDRVIASRIVLIGDAAHGIHPLSGQGVNLGFQDAAALAVLLKSLPAWMDPGSHTILRRYARARAEEPFMMQGVTDGLYHLFNAKHPAIRWARNQGMNFLNAVPVLGSALTRYAIRGRF